MAIWVFDHEPTRDEMVESLSTISAWSGSEKTMDEYIDYVIPQSGRRKTYVNGKETHVNEWRLYMTVHGRIMIVKAAHSDQPLSEHIELEWRAPWLIVSGSITSPIFGTAFDAATAWIGEKAKGADKTNPIENAITSWRGRVIAALCGGGIIPASGVASAEEVKQAEYRNEYENPKMMATVDASSPAVQQQAKQQGKIDNTATKKHIIQNMKDKCESDKDFEKKAMAWLKSRGEDVPDGETIIDKMLSLDIPEYSKAFEFIVKGVSDAKPDS